MSISRLLSLGAGMALLAAGANLGMAKAAVGGPTCDVPTDYATIQAAVNDPACTTINVAPGAYAENVVIGRAVTINGAQAGVATSGRASGGPGESTVSGNLPAGANAVFRIGASGVTIDGFTVKNAVT